MSTDNIDDYRHVYAPEKKTVLSVLDDWFYSWLLLLESISGILTLGQKYIHLTLWWEKVKAPEIFGGFGEDEE